ncbi:MAG: SHD1 domain-containing protein, partial [Planctomycetia bacterium]|nr:SHD1 domain-containing protein [Planctomycetia bacterium]
MRVWKVPGFPLVIVLVTLSMVVVYGREWTDSTGRYKVEAELESVSEDGKTVSLRRSDGKVVHLPYKKLGAKDRRYVLEYREEKAAEQRAKDQKLVHDAAVETDESRLWRGKDESKTLNAGFAILSEGGKIALFRKDNGDIVRLPVEELSDPDQEYIRSLLEKREEQ